MHEGDQRKTRIGYGLKVCKECKTKRNLALFVKMPIFNVITVFLQVADVSAHLFYCVDA